ncbi:MAG: hypothetical protein A3H23_09265 [Planctomycetes bacterium RIFCSPLOWO2_12_FULL_40_19]|nr:MAG: hypothetical protein A3H23_09265 [Planctomycetes bacterium RIFCSPLOWO2_12_FULL_40_19]
MEVEGYPPARPAMPFGRVPIRAGSGRYRSVRAGRVKSRKELRPCQSPEDDPVGSSQIRLSRERHIRRGGEADLLSARL